MAAGLPASKPAAVIDAGRVIARTPAAADFGVAVGQRRRQAQRACPQITLVEHDPARDLRAFEPLVRRVIDVSPRVEVIEPGWLTLRTRGPARYFGGERALADMLLSDCRISNAEGTGPGRDLFACISIGIADGRFASGVAARLAARRAATEPATESATEPSTAPVTGPTGPVLIIEPGGSPTFCASLSIAWLQLLGEADPDLVDLFARLGLRRLGDLAALAESDVMGRFGHPGVHAHRLAGGADGRPSSSVDPPPERTVEHHFDEPAVAAGSVVFVAKRLADGLASLLAAEGRVCTRLVVQIETDHGERCERAWYRSAGLPAPAMVDRVRWQLDAWIGSGGTTASGGTASNGAAGDAVTAGVTLLRLVPEESRADDGIQLGLWGGQSDTDRAALRTVARLSALVADDAVAVPVWQGGRLPDERYRWVPAVLADHEARAQPAGEWPGALPSPSPATVLPEPQPVDVLDAEDRPVQVSGRGAVSAPPAMLRWLRGDESSGWRIGRMMAIKHWAGPWPVEERWWSPQRSRRVARFQMVTDDDRAYLVVVERRQWWINAIYD